MDFPPRLSLARRPTPFYLLERLSAALGGPRIWIKRDDLTEAAAGGNKIRKLEFVLARARAAGCDALVTSGGIQSNHCRTTALLGARLGFEVHLVLRDEGDFDPVPRGNLLLDYLAGAQVHLLPRREYLAHHAERVAELAADLRRRGRTPWVIPVGASDGHGLWGYVDCARELAQDFAAAGIRPEVLVHATGSGGTQAGLVAGAALFELPCRVVGVAVCDSAAWFERKIRADLAEWAAEYGVGLEVGALPVEVDERFIGPGYARAGPEVYATIRRLGALEGVVLDPVYTGKAFHGLLAMCEAGEFDGCRDLVFLHTGGLFGLCAEAARLGFRRPPRGEEGDG
ncbi:MAG: D-cysteine desulfhydrase [Porticoccaceae bacterium]|nr:MAG: D-cysteine desulfhydrase [Porticoccaceae bacterium]